MKIGIDARLLPYKQKEGMAYYSLHLIEHLLKVDKANEYLLFYNLFRQGSSNFALDLSGKNNAKNKIFRVPGKVLDWLWMQLHFPPIEFFLGRLDLFHTLAFTVNAPYFYLPPQLGGRRIVTIHDIFPLMFPEKAGNAFNISEYKEGLEFVVKNADAIICVSQSAREDLLKFTGIPENKTYVVHSGISEDFYKVCQPEKINNVLKKYGITGKYLLNASRLDYNKNIVNIIKALHLLRKNHDFKLVVTGSRGNVADEVFATINNLGLSEYVIYSDYIPREDLVVLFSAAELFVFPSFYEAFGFPNLEAMKCEIPVVTSDIAPIREIVGDAAFLVDPASPEQIASAMARIIENPQLRNDLIAKGRERAKLFSWEKTAQNTLQVYRKVAG